MTIAVDKDYKTPLREEITDLFLAISISDPANKDLARVAILEIIIPLLVSLWCSEAHVQRALGAWKALWIYNGAIGVRSKLVGGESIRRFLSITVTLDQGNIEHVAISAKVVAYISLSDPRRQGSDEHLEMFPNSELVICAPHQTPRHGSEKALWQTR